MHYLQQYLQRMVTICPGRMLPNVPDLITVLGFADGMDKRNLNNTHTAKDGETEDIVKKYFHHF